MFKRARLKLTLWYLLIVMAISISFSFVIYNVYSNEVERFARIQRTRIETRLGTILAPLIVADPSLIEDTKERLVLSLTLINAAILAISGITGYFLAGVTLAPIKDMVDEQNRFISDASHEIGTPLTSLKTAMEVYLREKKPTVKESKILVAESIDEVNKLQALSSSLLQLAQYQKPQTEIKFEKLNLTDLLNTAIKKISPIANEKKIKIETKLEKVNLIGDKYGLIDLFVILLDNAIKYSPADSKIEIISQHTDGFVVISFKDHGIGISKDDIPHIFNRFYRTDTARGRKKSGGYGLGLSIAKKIVDSHRGVIGVKSQPGIGSTFFVKIPVIK